MHPFRQKTPKRRTTVKAYKHYRSHHATLREDFNGRCGYCDDTDKMTIRSFAIDHFVPQNPKTFHHDIEPSSYENLVYSCAFCNGAKSNKWGTNDATLHNDDGVGFIDPTEDDYTEFFRRDRYGAITSNGLDDKLAQHIITELKLWYPVHSITWKLEKLNVLEKEVTAEIDQLAPSSRKDKLTVIQNEIRGILLNLFRNLFAENE